VVRWAFLEVAPNVVTLLVPNAVVAPTSVVLVRRRVGQHGLVVRTNGHAGTVPGPARVQP
jgi:hypothetical protein